MLFASVEIFYPPYVVGHAYILGLRVETDLDVSSIFGSSAVALSRERAQSNASEEPCVVKVLSNTIEFSVPNHPAQAITHDELRSYLANKDPFPPTEKRSLGRLREFFRRQSQLLHVLLQQNRVVSGGFPAALREADSAIVAAVFEFCARSALMA
jgi:hypothetical protein